MSTGEGRRFPFSDHDSHSAARIGFSSEGTKLRDLRMVLYSQVCRAGLLLRWACATHPPKHKAIARISTYRLFCICSSSFLISPAKIRRGKLPAESIKQLHQHDKDSGRRREIEVRDWRPLVTDLII